MMNADLIACARGIVVTNRDDWREKHVITSGHTLQSIVRLFIGVKEMRLKAGQLQISGSSQGRGADTERTGQMFRTKVCLRECLRILICALRKMEYGQF